MRRGRYGDPSFKDKQTLIRTISEATDDKDGNKGAGSCAIIFSQVFSVRFEPGGGSTENYTISTYSLS